MRTSILLAAALSLGAMRAQDPGGSNPYDTEAIMVRQLLPVEHEDAHVDQRYCPGGGQDLAQDTRLNR